MLSILRGLRLLGRIVGTVLVPWVKMSLAAAAELEGAGHLLPGCAPPNPLQEKELPTSGGRLRWLALRKVFSGELFIFIYDRKSTPRLVAMLEQFASDPELSFSWEDVELLKDRIPAEWRVPL